MIKLIEICKRFNYIFPNYENTDVESALYSFFFLTNINIDNNQIIFQENEENLKSFNFGDIGQKYKDDEILKLQKIDDIMLLQISKFKKDLENKLLIQNVFLNIL